MDKNKGNSVLPFRLTLPAATPKSSPLATQPNLD